jgi:hypothetical protein
VANRREAKRHIKQLKAEGLWHEEEQHPMEHEPDHSHGQITKSFKNFLIAVAFIIIFSVVSVYGLYQLAKYFPEKVPWSAGQKLSGKSFPKDIPLYNGAVLAESEAYGSRLTFRYMLPLGAQSTARRFYEAEMIKNNWSRLASNEDLMEFYKKEGKRRVVIRIDYLNGKASLNFEITGNNENGG